MSTNPERSRATAFGLIKEREESGSFPIGERAEDSQRLQSDAVIAELAELSPELVSLIPEPPLEASRSFAPPSRKATPSERAELVIEDLSLQLDNPYLASSLVPPPKQPLPIRRAIAIGTGMLAAAAIGAVIQLSVLRNSGDRAQVASGSAGIVAPADMVAPAKQPAATETVVAQDEPAAPIAVAPQPVVAPAPAVSELRPVATSVAAKVEPAKVEPAKVDLSAITEPAAPAAPVRIARITPPAPPEPIAPVAEAAMPAPTTALAADLPEYPTRQQVTAGFESVRAALAQCAAGRSGTVEITASIANNGRIVHALVGGDFRGSTEGSCMARAVREAQFPAFSQPRLKVSYPISL